MLSINKVAVYHARVWLGLAAGIAGFFLAPAAWPTLARLLTGWNVGVLVFLVLAYTWMSGLSAQQIRSRYEAEDPSGPVILLVTTATALLSLIAIVVLLATVNHVNAAVRTVHMTLAGLTVVSSWALVPTMFTLHYADMFYSVDSKNAPLSFPGTSTPVFSDFVYFSFTIAAACQTSDVSTTRASIRKVVTAHTLVSFVFNVSILGFAINVSAGLLGG